MTKQFYSLMKWNYKQLEHPITVDMLEDYDDEPDEDLEAKINEADSVAGEDAEPYHAVICDENGVIYAQVINRGVDTIRTEFEIDADEWWDTYQPIARVDGETMTLLELKFHHRKLIDKLDKERRLWTEMGNGEIRAGYAHVNRLRHLVTRNPYPKYGEYVVRIPSPDNEDMLAMLESQDKSLENITEMVKALIAERDALKRVLEHINQKNIHVPMTDNTIRSIFGLNDDADVSHIGLDVRFDIQSNMEEAFYEFGDWDTIAENAASRHNHLFREPDNRNVCMECQHWATECTCPKGFGCNL